MWIGRKLKDMDNISGEKMLKNIEDELSLIAKKYNTDKYQHRYTPVYYEKFWSSRYDINKILEIGIADGSSLRTWSEAFPNTKIYGVDNREECVMSCKDIPRTEAIFGDITNKETIEKIKRICGNDIDMILDDGSHMSNDMITAFNFLFPILKDGGYYIIEDFEAGDSFGGAKEALKYFKDLVHCKTLSTNDSWLERHIISIEFFNFLIFIRKGIPDMIFRYLDSHEKMRIIKEK